MVYSDGDTVSSSELLQLGMYLKQKLPNKYCTYDILSQDTEPIKLKFHTTTGLSKLLTPCLTGVKTCYQVL